MDWLSTKSNSSFSNVLNQTKITTDIFALYESDNEEENSQFVNKIIACVFGIIIFMCNICVVISSGLILKNDQQRKSTYLLLGNVSLADSIIGLSIIFGVIVEKVEGTSLLCIFQIGTLVCSFMVSIFSVSFIAIDRYYYIVHGLYYQRWFNTTKVRIGILCIWVICLPLGFSPTTGWINHDLGHSRCYYECVFPVALILLNHTLSVVPILLVAILYSIILFKALKNVKDINKTVKNLDVRNNSIRERQLHADNVNLKDTVQLNNPSFSYNNKNTNIRKSATFSENLSTNLQTNIFNNKSKSSNDIDKCCYNNASMDSIDLCMTDQDTGTSKINLDKINTRNIKKRQQITKSNVKVANKWRAITVVMLTSGSFIITIMPFFITVTLYLSCQDKSTNPKCIHLTMVLNGPFRTLAFLNSILNPLIYAWWHKGFRRSITLRYRRCMQRFWQKDELR